MSFLNPLESISYTELGMSLKVGPWMENQLWFLFQKHTYSWIHVGDLNRIFQKFMGYVKPLEWIS